MTYRISVRSHDRQHWVQIGRMFTSRDDAVRFLAILPTDFKRVEEIGGRGHRGASAGALNPRRLEFARYLARTGRIGEAQPATPSRRADSASAELLV